MSTCKEIKLFNPFYDVIIYQLLNLSHPQAFFIRAINESHLFSEGHIIDDILDFTNVANVQMGSTYPPFPLCLGAFGSGVNVH